MEMEWVLLKRFTLKAILRPWYVGSWAACAALRIGLRGADHIWFFSRLL
jgi:hypothetical protein